MTDPHAMEEEIARKVFIGLKCGDVASAVFPSNFDRDRRQRLALALVELTRALTDFQGTDRETHLHMDYHQTSKGNRHE